MDTFTNIELLSASKCSWALIYGNVSSKAQIKNTTFTKTSMKILNM